MTHYSTLRVSPFASEKQILNAYNLMVYRLMGIKGDHTAELQELAQARNVLCDPLKREEYHKTLNLGPPPSKSILVFGQSGAGKTSVVNALLGTNLKTSGDACGCTFITTPAYASPTSPPSHKDYEIFDTVGLNEASSGTVSAEESVTELIKFLKSVKGGLNLMVLVMRGPRITDATKKNYELFIKIITRFKVPAMCVVTGLENEEPEDWVVRNKCHFDAAEMTFQEIVGGCFAVGKTPRTELMYAGLREESTTNLWRHIEQIASPKKIDFVSEVGLWALLRRIMGKILGGGWLYVNKTIETILLTLGVSEGKAREIASDPTLSP